MSFQYLLFDWDGCLADTISIWMAGYKKIFAEFNLSPTEREIVTKVFGDWQGPTKVGVKDNDLFIKKLLVEVNRGLPQAQLHQGVKSTLVKLRSLRKKMVIVTSSLKKFVWPALENHQLVDLIDGFLSIEDIEKNKPDPEIVNKALEKLNGSKNRAIIIGDSDKDVFTGQNAGIKTMIFFPAINQRFYTLEELSQLKPDYLITDFTEILNLV